MKSRVARIGVLLVVIMALGVPAFYFLTQDPPDPVAKQTVSTGFHQIDVADVFAYEKTVPMVSYNQTSKALNQVKNDLAAADVMRRLKAAEKDYNNLRSHLLRFTALTTTTSRTDTVYLAPQLLEDPGRCPTFTSTLKDQWIDATVRSMGDDASLWKVTTHDKYDLVDEWDKKSGQLIVRVTSHNPYSTVDPGSNTFYFKAPPAKSKRWSVGPSIGYALTPKGDLLAAGVSLQYGLLQW